MRKKKERREPGETGGSKESRKTQPFHFIKNSKRKKKQKGTNIQKRKPKNGIMVENVGVSNKNHKKIWCRWARESIA